MLNPQPADCWQKWCLWLCCACMTFEKLPPKCPHAAQLCVPEISERGGYWGCTMGWPQRWLWSWQRVSAPFASALPSCSLRPFSSSSGSRSGWLLGGWLCRGAFCRWPGFLTWSAGRGARRGRRARCTPAARAGRGQSRHRGALWYRLLVSLLMPACG